MPRQIPLKRARGGGGELDGCADVYLRSIITIIVLLLVGTFCTTTIDAIRKTAPWSFIVIGIILIAIAIGNRSQITSWLVNMENKIEQWNNKQFVLAVIFFIAIISCLIILAAILVFNSL